MSDAAKSDLALTVADLTAMADAARPKSPDDWGSATQIAAENKFFETVAAFLPETDFAAFEDWCLKATVSERIDQGLKLIVAEAKARGAE